MRPTGWVKEADQERAVTLNKLVVQDRWQTVWFDPVKPSKEQTRFLATIPLHKLPSTNFFALYEAFQAHVIQLIAADRTGTFEPATIQSSKDHATMLKEIDGLEREIAELKTALKRESQIGNKVSLNGKVRANKDAILKLEASLKISL